MSRYLYGYKNFTPNAKGATHYLIENTTAGISRYMSVASEGGRNILTFSETNYRVNNGSIALAYLGAVLTNWQNITYFIERDVETGFFMCYYVESAVIASGNVYFNVRVDYWASYLLKANISDIHVTRCNRNVGNGYYDEIKKCCISSLSDRVKIPQIDAPIVADSNGFIDEQSVAFVFSVSMVLVQNVLGTNSVSNTYLCAIELDKVRECFTNASIDVSSFNGFELAQQLISGIYKTGNGSAKTGDFNAFVNAIWCIPSFMLGNLVFSSGYNFHSKCAIGANTDLSFNTALIESDYFSWVISMPNLDKNFKWYFGTITGGLPLQLGTSSEHLYIEVDLSNNDINLTARQGDTTKDITNMFVVDSVGSTQQESDLKALVRNLGIVADVVNVGLQALKGGLSGGTIGALISGTSGLIHQAQGYLSMINEPNATATNARGKATASYCHYVYSYQIANHLLNYPFYFTGVKSASNEKETARKEGVNFNVYVDSLRSVLNYDLLGEGTETDTFIMCDATIENIPLTARDDIAKQLKEGVSYVTA